MNTEHRAASGVLTRDTSNPYKPPEAALGSSNLSSEEEIADAVEPFVRSRGPLQVLAFLSGLGALGTGCAILSTQMVARVALANQATASFGVMSAAYLVAAIVLWRLASGMRALGKEPTLAKVTDALNRMTQAWTIACAVTAIAFVASWAQRLAMASSVAPMLWQFEPQDPVVTAAARLRRVLIIMVTGIAVMMLAGAVGTFVKPAASLARGTSALLGFVVGGIAVQIPVVWLIWRQVPALDAFIARPSAATLKRVGVAHRLIWRVIAWGLLVIMVVGIVAAIVVVIAGTRARVTP